MPDFLATTSCRGCRPRQAALRRPVPRPNLIARLLRERHVARFVVAPDGFGKTALAAEYAETVFQFEHVFWVDAKSPCFLRDLDRGIIARTLLAEDGQPFLLVVEDVPPLDAERVALLAQDLDRVLARDCEVLVTCVPSCDAFECHHDRVKLSPADLLLTDDEVDARRSAADRKERPASEMPPSRRVASLVWGSRADRASFLPAALSEEMPADVLLLAFLTLCLQKGALSDLEAFASFDDELLELAAERYPYLGIQTAADAFDALPISIDEAGRVLSGRLAALSARSLFPGRDALASHAADALAADGRLERACDVARVLMTRRHRAAWLADRGPSLLERGCAAPACEVYRSLGKERAGMAAALDAGEACRRLALGDAEGARRPARRVVGNAAAPADLRAACALVLRRCSEGRERADALEAAVSCGRLVESRLAAEKTPEGSRRSAGDAHALAAAVAVERALAESCARGAETWLHWHDRGVRGPAMDYAAGWVLDAAADAPDCADDPRARRDEAVSRMAAHCARSVEDAAGGEPSLRASSMASALERAAGHGTVPASVCDAESLRRACRLRDVFHHPREELDRADRACDRERADRRRAPSAAAGRGSGPRASAGSGAGGAAGSGDAALGGAAGEVPVLTVNLFGGLEVYVGERRVDPALFRRQKVKVLLALLVLNRGRELSRDRLAGLLWPESAPDAARRNFYSVWSMLRRALSPAPGSCPYLIRQQNGLRLDPDLLASDVLQFEEACRALLFERPGYGGWAQLYAQVNDRFSNDLLPSEDKSEPLCLWRERYRSQLVDALVTASSRLVAAGQVQEGLWFARAARERDRTREDACIALMSAQIAAGQRTAALDTYFSCRRFLTDELGIDPSPETMRLYRSIIESEELLE